MKFPLVKLAVLMAATAALAGCSKQEPAPTAPPPAQSANPPALPPLNPPNKTNSG